mgnify:CR=1 FL=1
MRRQPGCAAAFSLIELLVVIAIISVLAAMLLPGLERAVEQSRMVSCANQMKQLSLGLGAYSTDNPGLMPRSIFESNNTNTARTCLTKFNTHWRQPLGTFLDNGYLPVETYWCPSRPERDTFSNCRHYHYAAGWWSDTYLPVANMTLPFRLAPVAGEAMVGGIGMVRTYMPNMNGTFWQPKVTVFMQNQFKGDTPGNRIAGLRVVFADLGAGNGCGAFGSQPFFPKGSVHDAGCNVLLIDGAVQYVPYAVGNTQPANSTFWLVAEKFVRGM